MKTLLPRLMPTQDRQLQHSGDPSETKPESSLKKDPLWTSLQGFCVGENPDSDTASSSSPALTFAMRLARENRWDLDYAERCIDEYKRFLYLAARAPHSVTPSDAVDQVWHQHLVYTDNYWNELCKFILPRPLHHGPTRGGKSERIRYADQYEQTLETYQRYFGDPPSDIWPAPAERFRQSAAAVRVDSGKNWIVPKPMQWFRPLATPGRVVATPALVLAFASMPLAVMFPFNLNGTEFLMFYAFLTIAVFVLMVIGYRIIYSGSNPATLDEGESRDWGTAAVLSGGKSRLLQTSIATLVHRGQLNCNDRGFEAQTTKMLNQVDGDDEAATRTMRAIFDTASLQDKPRQLEHLRLYGASEATRAETQLQASGLIKTPSQNFAFRVLQFSLLMGLFSIGGIRIVQGLSSGRPVMFLVFEMIAAAIAATIAISLNNPLTPAGQRRKKHLTKLAEQKRAKSDSSGKLVDESTVPLVLAVFGAAVASQCLFGRVDRGLFGLSYLFDSPFAIQYLDGA